MTDFIKAAGGKARAANPREGEASDKAVLALLGRPEEDRVQQGASEIVWMPDGEGLVVVFEGSLFEIDRDGSNLARLTAPGPSKHDISFSPGGSLLAFLQEGDIWFWNQNTNEVTQATRIAAPALGSVPGAHFSREDAGVSSYKWSPDGRYIAFIFEDRRRVRKVLIPDYLEEQTQATRIRRDFPGDNDEVRKVGIYSVEQGLVNYLDLEGETDRWVSSYQWAPVGCKLLIDQHSEDAEDRWLYVAKPDQESITQVWRDTREGRVSWFWASDWQSDGEGIVFVSDREGRHHLYALRFGQSEPRQLTRGDWSVVGEHGTAPVAVNPSTKQVFFVSTKKSPYERHVYTVPENGGDVQQITSRPGTHYPVVAPNGSRVALLHSSDSEPPELYIVESEANAKERRITSSPPGEFHSYHWVQPRYVTFRSHVDDVTLHGRLLVPPGLDPSRKYPVIIGPVYPNTVRNVWGDRQEWRGLYSTFQQYLVVERQYIVMQVDVRGSVGYGRAFRERLFMDYGGIDVDDIHSGVLYLKTLPYVDSERIGIWGSSYGGLMTAMSLMRKPGLYKAGIAAAPATNIWHATPHEVRVCRRPEVHEEPYRKGSVVTYGDELADPLMIIHGMQDTIVLFKDSVVFAEKLMRLGKNFEFVVIPSAVHQWSRKDYVAYFVLTRMVEFFEHHLRGGSQ